MAELTHEQWLEARKKHLGGSDVAAILGLSPWRSSWQTWAEKTGAVEPDDADSDVMKRGRILEEPIAQMYAEETGFTVETPAEKIKVGSESWMAGSADRIVIRPDGIHGLEIKTSKSRAGWGESGAIVTGLGAADVMPPYYSTQCLWYMAVYNLDRWDMAVMFGLDDVRFYTIHRDSALELSLVTKCREWWHKHIVDGIEPVIDGSKEATLHIVRTHPKDTEGLREATEEERAWVLEMQNLSDQINAMQARKDELENLIGQAVGDGRGLVGLGTWVRVAGRSTIDTKALQTEHPEIYQQYSREGQPSGYFRINIKRQES